MVLVVHSSSEELLPLPVAAVADWAPTEEEDAGWVMVTGKLLV